MELLNYSNINQDNSHCLVCGSHSVPQYVDLTVTSYTSHSETPVKEKLRAIIGQKWIISEPDLSFMMCLTCFQLVNQYDMLEAQMYSIKTQLCDKYVAFHGNAESQVLHQVACVEIDKTITHETTVSREKRQPAHKTRVPPVRKKKLPTEKKDLITLEPIHSACRQGAVKKSRIGSNYQWSQNDEHIQQDTGHILEISANSHLTQSTHLIQSYNNPIENTAWKAMHNGSNVSMDSSKNHIQDTHEDLPEEELSQDQPGAVYDELNGLLIPGERLRIGIAVSVEQGTSYNCCYCGHLFVNDVSLRSHVISSHHPEVLTAQIPVELGLGTKVNCGIHLSNVTAVSEFAKPFVCIFCDGAFKFKSNIFLHFKEKHTPYKPFSCVDCHENFRRTMELSRHRVYYCPFRKKAQNINEKKSK